MDENTITSPNTVVLEHITHTFCFSVKTDVLENYFQFHYRTNTSSSQIQKSFKDVFKRLRLNPESYVEYLQEVKYNDFVDCYSNPICSVNIFNFNKEHKLFCKYYIILRSYGKGIILPHGFKITLEENANDAIIKCLKYGRNYFFEGFD